MNGQIPWWQSRTIWFGMAQAVIGLVVAFGLLSDEQGSNMLTSLDTVIGMIMAALAVGQVQGRWTATKEIKPNIVPPSNPSEPTGAP